MKLKNWMTFVSLSTAVAFCATPMANAATSVTFTPSPNTSFTIASNNAAMHKNLSSSLEQQLQTVLGITENSWDKAELNVTAINGTYTPVLQIGGQSIPINLTDQTIQTFDSPNGTIYKLAGQTTILGSTATLVLDFIPNTDYHQGTITIMDPNGPVVEFFGTAFLTQQDENTITSNSPKTASIATIAPAATSSPEWHFQGNNDTQTIMGKSIGKNTCVIGGSDYFNGPSSGSERVEVWGTTEAENYLNERFAELTFTTHLTLYIVFH
ncbi:hypothetical protein ACOALA_10530 [Alicyclobacillus acidoterrestris]|uniref:hypothetical protein n=1 Tax=Alicyclobacillus acidoterrestris TaxID=1450 RepID=UPI003F537546